VRESSLNPLLGLVVVSLVLVFVGWQPPLSAAPSVVFALQERSVADERGEVVRVPTLEFVAQVRGDQFRNPELPSQTDYRLFSQAHFKDRRYYLWRSDRPEGTATASPPERLPSLYGSLEAPLKGSEALLPLPELELLVATDQQLPQLKRRTPGEESLSAVDALAQDLLQKQGLRPELSKEVPRIWSSGVAVPGHPDTVAALYRRLIASRQGGVELRQIVNLIVVAEPVTEKGQTAWQVQWSLAGIGPAQATPWFGPLAVADLNGDGYEDLLVRETRFDRWSYGIYSYFQGRWQERYHGREGSYASDLPSDEEEPK